MSKIYFFAITMILTGTISARGGAVSATTSAPPQNVQISYSNKTSTLVTFNHKTNDGNCFMQDNLPNTISVNSGETAGPYAVEFSGSGKCALGQNFYLTINVDGGSQTCKFTAGGLYSKTCTITGNQKDYTVTTTNIGIGSTATLTIK